MSVGPSRPWRWRKPRRSRSRLTTAIRSTASDAGRRCSRLGRPLFGSPAMLTLSIGRKKRLHAVTFSPSGRDLAAVGGDNVLRVWDSFTGDLKHSAPVQETSSGYALTFLDDSRLVFRGVGLFLKDLAADTWEQLDPRIL